MFRRCAIGLSLVFFGVGFAWGGVLYTVTDLGQTDTVVSVGLNNLGQVVWNTDGRAFLYSAAGGIQDFNTLVAPPRPGLTLTPTAINDNGQIVGTVNGVTGQDGSSVFLYSGGNRATLITSPTAWLESAAAISNNGQVTGRLLNKLNGQGEAFRYNSSGGVKTLGTLPGGVTSYAYGINNEGQVVGFADTTTTSGGYHNSAFLYNGNGPMQDIGPLVGSETSSNATDINELGQVVGRGLLANGVGNAYIYSSVTGELQHLGALGGTGLYSGALGINNRGEVVGSSEVSVNQQHAFVFSGSGPMQDLNDLIDPSLGLTLRDATAINDSGQIIAFSVDSSGGVPVRLILLTPVPEPSTVALLGMGAIGLLAYTRRRRRESSMPK